MDKLIRVVYVRVLRDKLKVSYANVKPLDKQIIDFLGIDTMRTMRTKFGVIDKISTHTQREYRKAADFLGTGEQYRIYHADSDRGHRSETQEPSKNFVASNIAYSKTDWNYGIRGNTIIITGDR